MTVGGADIHVRNNVVVANVNAWSEISAWLEMVSFNGGDFSDETASTYRYHVAKLRWFCEREICVTLTAWGQEHVNAFIGFLRAVPEHALCAKVDTGRSKLAATGEPVSIFRFARCDEPGYSPFRKTPSPSSRDDILRCVRAIFAHLLDVGVIARNPMARVRMRKQRQTGVSRALELDLYDYVLEHLDGASSSGDNEHRLRARDRFAFVILRELGLRASELVGAHMRDIYPLSDPKSRITYWVLKVAEQNAKGGVERTVPVTQVAMDALISYRKAFGLPALPEAGEQFGLLLSTRTTRLRIGEHLVRDAQSRRYFGSWGTLTSRKTLYQIVAKRMGDAAQALMTQGRADEAERLKQASPHWLRHTFAKAALLSGVELRVVAQSLGHANISTTMAYTVQDALDQIRDVERACPGRVAQTGIINGSNIKSP
jgi:integrase/recombinase XerC